MPLTEVECFLFHGQSLAHWVTGFGFNGKQVEVMLAPITYSDGPVHSFKAIFPDAVILSVNEDDEGRDEWPLDIIGFDSSTVGGRFKFTLNCGCVEWAWESGWPAMRTAQ